MAKSKIEKIVNRINKIESDIEKGVIIDVNEKERLEKELQHYLLWESMLKK